MRESFSAIRVTLIMGFCFPQFIGSFFALGMDLA
jgi:hypothetical protein